MIENHRKCPYWTLLRHNCPSVLDVTKERQRNWTLKKKVRQATPKDLLDNSILVKDVFLFLRIVFLRIVPLHVFGNKQNVNCFLKHVKQLLSVQLHGKISLFHMVEGLKTKPMKWLKSYHKKQQKLMLNQTIHFLTTKFICPLIQSFFYVTESTASKNRVFFYRKKTWQRLVQLAARRFVRSCHLIKVTEKWVQEKISQQKCLGVSTLRFTVKKPFLRPIMNLSRKKNGGSSVNQHLETLLHVLTFEKDTNPSAFGVMVMDFDDIWDKWKTFLSSVREQQVEKLYFVKVDIENCFDTINPCLLYSIVARMFTSKTQFKIYQYRKHIFQNGIVRHIYFDSLFHPSLVCTRSDVKIETRGSYNVEKKVLLAKLSAHLFGNVINIGKQFYVQTLGIAQGSKLSTILCGAYFGYMEQTMLKKMRNQNDLFVRMIDDVLFVTPDKGKAQNFLRRFLDGFPEFNCRSNLKKCCSNFEYCHPVHGIVPHLAEQEKLKFCGLAFDTQSFSVFLDFSNYANLKTSDTVSWDLTEHPGESLRKKVMQSVTPKCYPILFDHTVNSIECIKYNVISIFATCAVKFHCLVLHLPPKQRILQNPAFFTNIILSLPQVLKSFICKKIQHLKKDGKIFVFPRSFPTIESFCNQTFLFKLKRHYVMYKPVIENLSKLEERHGLVADISGLLLQIYTDIRLS